MSGTGSKDRPQDAVRSRRIGWRAAGRLLDGQDGGRGTEELRTLITLASVPMYAITARTESAERDAASRDLVLIGSALHDVTVSGTPPLPDALLAAFRESASLTPTTTTTAAKTTAVRRQPPTRTVVLRFGAAVLVVCGAGTAAASVGVLPAGMQRIAHEYLGVGSAPAQSTQARPSSAAASRGSAGSDNEAVPTPTTGAASASTVISLCRQISQAGDDWSADLSAADRATLIAAAGYERKVTAYCKQLLDGMSNSAAAKGKPDPSASSNASATPSPEPTGKPSGTPNAKPTTTRGNTHASHAPAPAPQASSSTH